jgi:ligand-binding SRPBCC domain-containing protein|tara:strand:- start:2449 stop:2910 length:462 start_codon:yes stop_codon:yes gene_type:complete
LKLYQLKTKQNIPISIDKAWSFFSNPENLKKITPKEMNFTIISGANRSIYSGQIIQYKVTPMLGISTKWVTEITHVKEKEYFVDEQRFGPYALWHHKHFIKEIEGGIEMEDIVDYKIPFGLLGQFAHWLFVKNKLNQIFKYREQILIKLFGKF